MSKIKLQPVELIENLLRFSKEIKEFQNKSLYNYIEDIMGNREIKLEETIKKKIENKIKQEKDEEEYKENNKKEYINNENDKKKITLILESIHRFYELFILDLKMKDKLSEYKKDYF